MPVDYRALGNRIKHFRALKHWSQEELSERMNISRKQISVFEIGTAVPGIDTLVELANILDVSADDLLSDSLLHTTSSASYEMQDILVNCSKAEATIILKMAKELKAILYSQGI